jgi:N-acetylglucosamine malate deacetylase 1
MKPILNYPDLGPLLAFGAHPDDIEFGCGGVIASETDRGRKVHFVVCSRGEAGTHGTPEQLSLRALASAGTPFAKAWTRKKKHLDNDNCRS